MNPAEGQRPEKHGRDWQPWAILSILALVLLGIVWLGHAGERPLAVRTAQSGLPLTREQRSVEFQTADLTFDVQPSAQRINARAVLAFLVKAPIDRLQFDLDPELPISAIVADGRTLDRPAWANDGGLVAVRLPRAKRAGDRLTLAITYEGRPHIASHAPWDGGFVWAHAPGGEPWVATAVEGEGCDLFWPCFDNSQVEVGTVTQHIIVPKGLSAPSNGRLLGVDHLADGRTRWNWQASHPNNYAVAIDVGPFRLAQSNHLSRFGNRFPIQYWYLPGEDRQAAALLAEMERTVDFFEATIGPYPWGAEKVGVVETPHLGMEHQTINAYGNAYKAAPEGYDWLFDHEFSHEWFGNQLTNADWDDMWLHEGFATYMQPLTLEWLDGRMAYDAAMFKERQQIANRHPIVSGRHATEDDVSDPAKGPGNDIYYKASWVLHTLRSMIGDDAFWRATRRLVYGRVEPRPGNFQPRFASTDEFIALVNQESHRDLHWFFEVYLRQAPLPRLVVSRSGTSLSLQWKTPKGLPFPMPIDVRVDGRIEIVPMTGGHGSLTLPSPLSLVTVDPESKILRQSDAIDRFRADPSAKIPYGPS
ncbi:M1 family metallopeptidase [Sphingomonas sp.]|uniref:M1 family metallopeptidase n=1 Tax=Sphingomonas sp. TaxID=28214 RepID=UPI0025D202A5|nr:M1 family metallopeptidase [Sphingomonas sp.]